MSFISSVITLFWEIAYYLSRLNRVLKLTSLLSKNINLFKFRWKVCKIKVKVNVTITIIIECAWLFLNKQGLEYASIPKYAKILNMSKFWIWQGSLYASVTKVSDYARICLDRVMNISLVLNEPGFWIWQGSENPRVTQGSKFFIIWLNVFIVRECAWICLNLR